MVKTSNKAAQSKSKTVKLQMNEAWIELLTIRSEADLDAPVSNFQADEEATGHKHSEVGTRIHSSSEDSECCTSLCVSNDDSSYSDGDCFSTLSIDEQKDDASTKNADVVKIEVKADADLPVRMRDTERKKDPEPLDLLPPSQSVALSTTDTERKTQATMTKFQIALPTTACVSTVMWAFSMITPLPVGMAVARLVRSQPLVALMWVLSWHLGKRNAVDFVWKLARFSAYSLVLPSVVAPMAVGNSLAKLAQVLEFRSSNKILSVGWNSRARCQ